MPYFTSKLGAQPIGKWPEPDGPHFRDVPVREHPRAFAFFVTIHACAQCLGRHALVYGMIRGDNGGDH